MRRRSISIFERIVYAINILVALLLLISCCLSYVTFQFVSTLSVLSLLVPFLVIINVLFFVFWIIRRRKQLLVSLVVLCISYFVFGSFYRISESNEDADNKDLTIMTFNAWGFNKNGWIKDSNIGDKIIEFIKEEDPDILCVQEHSRIRRKQLRHYPYRSETPFLVPRSIQAIFSKYPIISDGSLDLPDTRNNIIYADILYKNDTIRVYNIHLQSFSIVPNSETFSDSEQSEKNYKRLVKTFSKQLEQAKIFDEHVHNSPYTNIVCGDFNNTQFSNVYRIVKNDMTDSFLEKGEKFGRTYNILGFPIRIDYILSDPEFEVLSHQNFNEKLSDHYPVMATLRLKSDE